VTLEELRYFDGKDGKKTYFAYKGIIYDVTDSPLWKDGRHMERLDAGLDLTDFLSQAPHGEEVFETLPVVGSLTTSGTPAAVDTKARFKIWYAKYHPHPATVHFPIALHFFAGGMDLLFLADPSEAYEVSVFYAFFVATVMGAVAMVPGVLSWWVNYDFSRASAFIIKLYVSLFTVIIGGAAIALRLEEPRVAYGSDMEGWFYHGTVFVTVLCVIVLGYYGGKITWGGRR
jgi:predicted heme/steroid binding protein/uncharacterized membrane protein